MALHIDELLANPDAQVRVVGLSGGGITAFINQDFNMAGSSEYDTIFDSSHIEGAQKFLDQAMSLEKRIKDPVAKAAMQRAKRLSLRTIDNSVFRWTGSGRPAFSLPLVFIDVHNDGTVITNLKKLYSSVYPIGNRVSKKGIGSTLLTAPLGYKGMLGETAEGTVAIEIGRWFRATGLIFKSVDFTMSQEVTERGTPLYATGTCQLETFRAVTHREYIGFFR